MITHRYIYRNIRLMKAVHSDTVLSTLGGNYFGMSVRRPLFTSQLDALTCDNALVMIVLSYNLLFTLSPLHIFFLRPLLFVCSDNTNSHLLQS